MTAKPQPKTTSNLVFGWFSNGWAWRVEWLDAKGKLQTKDFIQKDLRPGVAKAEAVAFREDLSESMAA